MWPYRLMMAIRDKVPGLLDFSLQVAERISHLPREGMVMMSLMAALGEEDRKALADDFAYQAIVASFQEAMKSGAHALRGDGDLYLMPWEFDVAELKKVPLFYHGGRDKNIPLNLVEKYIRRIPGATLIVHERDGHYSLPVLRLEEITDALLTD